MTLRAASPALPPGLAGSTTAIAGAQALAVPYILAKFSIPFIGLSTGTISAGGAISAITALPIVYPNAYVYLPANAAATSSPAGWYFAKFTTTQLGTLFLNQYTTGIPTIPASPTACTTASSFTGDTTEEFGPTITIPANAMGPNGIIQVIRQATQNNSANEKSNRIRFSGNAGTILFNQNAQGTATSFGGMGIIQNVGATNSQLCRLCLGSTVTDSNSPTAYAAVDTTVATTVVISMLRAVATDNMITESILIELLSDGT